MGTRSVWIPDKLLKDIDELCEQHRFSLSSVVTMGLTAIKAGLGVDKTVVRAIKMFDAEVKKHE